MTHVSKHYYCVHRELIPLSVDSPLKVRGTVMGFGQVPLFDYSFTIATHQITLVPLSRRANRHETVAWIEGLIRAHYDRSLSPFTHRNSKKA